MWELDHREGWVPKNWCFSTVVLKKTLESPLDGKEIKLLNPKGNQPWIFIWRAKAKAETSILWPLDAKNWLIGKDLDAGKDWGKKEKRGKEDKMVGQHHQLSGHEFEQTLRECRTEEPGVLQSMGSQRVRHNLVTEQQQQQKLQLTKPFSKPNNRFSLWITQSMYVPQIMK